MSEREYGKSLFLLSPAFVHACRHFFRNVKGRVGIEDVISRFSENHAVLTILVEDFDIVLQAVVQTEIECVLLILQFDSVFFLKLSS